MTKLKYIIWNPFLGRATFANGGWVAMYTLFENMKNLGEEIYLAFEVEQHLPGLRDYEEGDFFSLGGFPNLENFRQLDLNECVTIYPEAAFSLRMDGAIGNPTNSKYVVRWLLHYPDYHLGHGSETWGEKDLLFAFSGWQDFESKKRKFNTQGILTCLHTDLETFKDYNKKREGSCYIRRKNLNRNFNKDLVPKNSVCVEEILNSGNEKDIANCLNSYEYFYSYDENTYFSVLAALCGCVSVVVANNEDQKSWYENKPSYYRDAVAYGDKNINHVKKNMHLIKAGVMTSEKQNLKTVENFIKITQEHFCK